MSTERGKVPDRRSGRGTRRTDRLAQKSSPGGEAQTTERGTGKADRSTDLVAADRTTAARARLGAELDPPSSAREAFGDQIEIVARYVRLLATEGVKRGLLGPRETPKLWDRHVLNCAAVASLLPKHGEVLDLGSGAGLPGIVLAVLRPDLRFTLVDANGRRTSFLTQCVADLGLTNVSVRKARAEDLAGQLTADAVTARAVAPLERLVGWALPLLKPDGRLLAIKGESAAEEVRRAMPKIQRSGAQGADIVIARGPATGSAATVVVVRNKK